MPDLTKKLKLSFVKYEKKGKIAYITLNRPEKLNALNGDILEGLDRIFADLNDDENIWVIILRGAGSCFCSGFDFTVPGGQAAEDSMPRGLQRGEVQIKQPIIASIHGYCLGGGMGLAIGCDIRICSESAKLGFPQARNGIITQGGPQWLPRLIPGVAKWYLFSGKFIPGTEAQRLGLVARCVPDDKLAEETENMAQTLLECSPTSIRFMKEMADMGFRTNVAEGMHISSLLAKKFFKTQDYVEGIAAFREKRKPVWKNR